MITVFRYRTMKPRDGKIEFTLHREATILGFSEYWRKDTGWDVVVDALVDTDQPVERRRFFLCTGGDRLDALGENAFAYHVGTHEAKGYCAYLFEVSHLPDQIISQLEADWGRLQRHAPGTDELSYKARMAKERKEKMDEKRRRVNERADRERAERERLARDRAATDEIVTARQEAEVQREQIAAETPTLRVVES
jgi:hypothetical protein